LSDLRIRLVQSLGLILAIGLFLLFYLIYNFNHPRGFSSQILIQNANESFVLVMVGMAQTVPALVGGLDLSVGAVMTMINTLASYLLVGWPLQILGGIVICLATAALAGFVNGCLVVYGRIQPIIVTLATGAVYMGIALFLRPTPGGKVDGDFSWAMTNDLFELAATYGFAGDGDAAWFRPFAWLPLPLILMVLVVLLVWLPFKNSVTGRGVYAVARPRAPPTCRACASTAARSRPSPWPASSPASPGSTSRSRPRRAMPTCRRPAPTRSTPSPPW